MNGKYNDVIDFMQRLKGEVINKRQLEKLIQAGAFDSIEKRRSMLFENVLKFVELFGGESTNQKQDLLFDDQKISIDDSNLFFQNIKEWNSTKLLNNELEVIGFYFSDHPLNYYPQDFFVKYSIIDYNEILEDQIIQNAKVAGSILDINERSNKEGKKYAFVTVSGISKQFELTIFSENLSKYRSILKEGNVLIFEIDLVRRKQDQRCFIKNIEIFDKTFARYKKNFNIYITAKNLIKFKDDLFVKNENPNENIFVYINFNSKLINLDFRKKYSINSFKYLDNLSNSKKLDYSLEIT